ncbi:MAG: Maf family nucleotide pyrophosphatase [Bacteroidota bacterium]|nr:Maf family nucleotide pyrophosphatase [Bacteroidota bacterium]
MNSFLEHLSNYQIFLASRSPRREQLLRGLEIPFEIWLKEEVEEDFPEKLSEEDIPLHLARLKAKPYLLELESDSILITADTIVSRDGHVLGKPHTFDEAVDMLESLSGSQHKVITGVCLSGLAKTEAFSATTIVSFSVLTREEIEFYIKKFRPFDKAGSYGIQEWIGLVAVDSIMGSYFNVMGLPIQRLYQEIKRFTNYNSTSNNYE